MATKRKRYTVDNLLPDTLVIRYSRQVLSRTLRRLPRTTLATLALQWLRDPECRRRPLRDEVSGQVYPELQSDEDARAAYARCLENPSGRYMISNHIMDDWVRSGRTPASHILTAQADGLNLRQVAQCDMQCIVWVSGTKLTCQTSLTTQTALRGRRVSCL